MKISAVLAARNEEANIERCLKSISWADEIVVVVEKSTDRTLEIAKRYSKRVFEVAHEEMFHKNRQKAIDKASGDWVLNIDADEEITPALRDEIKEAIKNEKFNGYRLPRKSLIFGKWIEHTGWYPDFQIKLFKKGKGRLPCQSIHEHIEIDGEIGTLTQDLLHYHYSSIFEFIEQMNQYTSNDAKNIIEKKETIIWQDAIRFPVAEFLKRFFYMEGYRDGLHGLVLSLLQSFNRLAVFAKVWEKQGFPKASDPNFRIEVHSEMKSALKDYYYWLNKSEPSSAKKYLYKIFRKGIV
jgi:glycosyltransferase involved in cell wall biosynthesis